MKTIAIILILTGMLQTINAQDIIYRLDGSNTEGKVIKVSEATIKYIPEEKPEGTIYFISRSKVSKIVYSNGYTQQISEQESEVNYSGNNSKKWNSDKLAKQEGPHTEKLRRHIVYGEILGMSGFFSVNYLPTIISSPNGAFSIKGRIGVGMSNKSIHFPHGILFGFGSRRHQFEIGIQGAVITGLADGDIFEFLHSDGKTARYSFSPTVGYRLISKKGFTFNVNMLVISAENASGIYHPIAGKSRELSPWFGVGLGYAF